MKDPGLGLSVRSTKIIGYALIILSLVVPVLVYFSNRNMISPSTFALTAAALFGILVIIVLYLVVREEGWESIFPP